MIDAPTPRTDAALELASDPDGAREVCALCEQLERELAEYKDSHATALREREATEKEVDAMLIRALKAERSLTEERAQHAEDIDLRAKAGKAFFASLTQDTTRLEAELAKASNLQQTVTIAEQTIREQAETINRLRSIYLTHHEEAEKLTHQIAEARDQAHNADLRTNRAKRDTIEAHHALAVLQADINALLTEPDPEAHAQDRHIGFTRRKIAFLDKHPELLKPRQQHEDDLGSRADTEDGTKQQPA